MDPFCLKQFSSSVGGQHIPIPCQPNEFVQITNQFYDKETKSALKDGYAPFCKHLFIPASYFSFSLPCAYAEITDANKHQLESTYSARTEKELPVLTRYFTKGSVTPSPATFLDVILYSREQINKENAAMKDKPVVGESSRDGVELSDEYNSHKASDSSSWEWGIVSIKPQNVDYETPMNPITIMRNALGVEEGGSGIPLNRDAYLKSVQFWQKHALVQ